MIRGALALFALVATPALAQSSPQIMERAASVLALLRDGKAISDAFAPSFIEQVPLDRLTSIAAELRANNGTVKAIEAVDLQGANLATLRIGYEHAVLTVRIAVEQDSPHRLIGLLVTSVARRDDSAEKIIADVQALPGRASLLVTAVGTAAPPMIAYNTDMPLATGSQFKLFVLAELARQIAAGERRWSDVVPLGPPSLPSGVMQDWPRGAPVTLSTLATEMISISDNTAADTLLSVLGRERVDAMRARVGATAGSLPVLATREAFVLKMAGSTALRRAWERGSLAERRALLRSNAWPLAAIEPAELAGAPLHIDSVEWPATTREIAGVLGVLRAADKRTLDILAIAPNLASGDRERFAYTGYKGGSESGVVALAWLLRTKDGRWFAVAGAWNDATVRVDPGKFAGLLGRAVAFVAGL